MKILNQTFKKNYIQLLKMRNDMEHFRLYLFHGPNEMTQSTNLYRSLRGSFTDVKSFLETQSKEWCENSLIDWKYNNFLYEWADRIPSNISEEIKAGGKRVPYFGWEWRHFEFHDLEKISIGKLNNTIGFIEKNKWACPERYLTIEEATKIIGFLDEAISIKEDSISVTNLNVIIRDIEKVLNDLWNYMQTLEI